MRKLFLTLGFLFAFPALAAAAITSIGSVGTCGSTTPGTTCVVTISNTFNANNVGLVRIGSDNFAASDGSTNEIKSVVDSVGNTYQKLCEYTYAEGGAGNGAMAALWVGRAAVEVPISGTITVTWANSVTARVVQVQELGVTAGNSLQVAGTCKTENINSADAGSLTTDTLPSKEYLFVRSIAFEETAGAINTVTTGYTVITGFAATTGTDATSISVVGERRILTGTADTSNPILSNTATDGASIYVALEECLAASCGVAVTAKPRPPVIVQ